MPRIPVRTRIGPWLVGATLILSGCDGGGDAGGGGTANDALRALERAGQTDERQVRYFGRVTARHATHDPMRFTLHGSDTATVEAEFYRLDVPRSLGELLQPGVVTEDTCESPLESQQATDEFPLAIENTVPAGDVIPVRSSDGSFMDLRPTPVWVVHEVHGDLSIDSNRYGAYIDWPNPLPSGLYVEVPGAVGGFPPLGRVDLPDGARLEDLTPLPHIADYDAPQPVDTRFRWTPDNAEAVVTMTLELSDNRDRRMGGSITCRLVDDGEFVLPRHTVQRQGDALAARSGSDTANLDELRVVEMSRFVHSIIDVDAETVIVVRTGTELVPNYAFYTDD